MSMPADVIVVETRAAKVPRNEAYIPTEGTTLGHRETFHGDPPEVVRQILRQLNQLKEKGCPDTVNLNVIRDLFDCKAKDLPPTYFIDLAYEALGLKIEHHIFDLLLFVMVFTKLLARLYFLRVEFIKQPRKQPEKEDVLKCASLMFVGDLLKPPVVNLFRCKRQDQRNGLLRVLEAAYVFILANEG
ncbi:hypothetical protein TRICI_003625 [Trichomonascus ciferrii]|uniref:Uncharacterized protein n=1 Tax=Trichomonascus ciferrii TaxID=44093 RepID=A0A642V3A8_9ASCO|nr:hypothetical protein TRICI_003625 [Trichomonascus ciferrii]